MFSHMCHKLRQLASGNIVYSPPRSEMRGADSVARMAFGPMAQLLAAVQSAGQVSGQYKRLQPFTFLPSAKAMPAFVSAGGTQTNVSGYSGNLIDPHQIAGRT